MKNFFKYNRVAAIGALVLIVALSIFGGVNRTVYSYKSKAEKAFSASDTSASSDLKKYADFASQLSAIARSNGTDTSALDKSIAELDTTSPFKGGDRAAEAIRSSSSVVFAELSAKKDVDEQQMRSATSFYYEMDSVITRLKNNKEYGNAARRYNKAIHSFPANILTGARDDAAVFDG